MRHQPEHGMGPQCDDAIAGVGRQWERQQPGDREDHREHDLEQRENERADEHRRMAQVGRHLDAGQRHGPDAGVGHFLVEEPPGSGEWRLPAGTVVDVRLFD